MSNYKATQSIAPCALTSVSEPRLYNYDYELGSSASLEYQHSEGYIIQSCYDFCHSVWDKEFTLQ